MTIPNQNIKNFDYQNWLSYLRNWRSWENPDAYDFGAIVHIMLACLDNIRLYATEGEIEYFPEYLDEKQKQFFQKLANSIVIEQNKNIMLDTVDKKS